MNHRLADAVTAVLRQIDEAGLRKHERIIDSPQGVEITVDGRRVLNVSANNYLGLANDPELRAAVIAGLERYGYGLSSVRFISGTQTQHRDLERRLGAFVGQDDAILYSSCFDANTGLFETILTDNDAIISDQLNHASVIDGIRLCKAERLVYDHSDLHSLEEQLRAAKNARIRLIATDGVFSMDGEIAKLSGICDLAEQYDAAVMVDDSHGTGVLGGQGRGSLEMEGVLDRVDIVTSTLGKALGGASGGFTASSTAVTELLRQRSRPYLFSNSLPPIIVAGALHVLSMVATTRDRRLRLLEHTARFRSRMREAGFTIPDGIHPIVPIMLGDAALAKAMAEQLLERGIFVIGFWYPVVPEGKARIRVQLSAAHTTEQIDHVCDAFTAVGKALGIIS